MTVRRKNTRKESEPDPKDYPKLRPDLSVYPYETDEGSLYIALEDPVNLSDQIILLTPDFYSVLSLFDGTHSRLDLFRAYEKNEVGPDFLSRLEAFLDLADAHYFLNNDRYRERLASAQKAYRDQNERQPALSGVAYPDQPDKLQSFLDSCLTSASVPKAILNSMLNHPVSGMVVPHIDLQLGGAVYGVAYRLLQCQASADLYVIIGTGHQGIENLFALSDKDFVTPRGRVKTDADLVHRIQRQLPYDLLAEEWIHENEHSIEFQTLFLQHTVRQDFKILPLLCSFPHQIFEPGYESYSSVYAQVIHILNRELGSYPGSVCLIASVDLAHVGTRYGDHSNPTPSFLARVEQNDRELLSAISVRDTGRMHSLIQDVNNRFNVCGYAPLMTFLPCLPSSHGHLLDYTSASMDSQKSTVTFASMLFW